MQPGDIDWIFASSVPSTAVPWLLLFGNVLRWCRAAWKGWLAMQNVTVTTRFPRASHQAPYRFAHTLDANPFEEMVDDMKMEAVFRLNARNSIDDSSLSVLASPGMASPLTIAPRAQSIQSRSQSGEAFMAQCSATSGVAMSSSIEGNLVRIEAQLRLVDDDLQPIVGLAFGENDFAGSLLFDLDPALFASLLETARGGRSLNKTQRSIAGAPQPFPQQPPPQQPPPQQSSPQQRQTSQPQSAQEPSRRAASNGGHSCTSMVVPAPATMTYTVGREFSDLAMDTPSAHGTQGAPCTRKQPAISDRATGPWIEHIVLSSGPTAMLSMNATVPGFQGTSMATGMRNDALTMRDVTIQGGAALVRYTAFEPFIFRNATYIVGGVEGTLKSPVITPTAVVASWTSPSGLESFTGTAVAMPKGVSPYVPTGSNRDLQSTPIGYPMAFTTTSVPSLMATRLPDVDLSVATATNFTHVVSRGSGSMSSMNNGASTHRVAATAKRATSQWNRVDGLDFRSYGPQCHVVLCDVLASETASGAKARRMPGAQRNRSSERVPCHGPAIDELLAPSSSDILAALTSTHWMLF